jgi:hypothetical protein
MISRCRSNSSSLLLLPLAVVACIILLSSPTALAQNDGGESFIPGLYRPDPDLLDVGQCFEESSTLWKTAALQLEFTRLDVQLNAFSTSGDFCKYDTVDGDSSTTLEICYVNWEQFDSDLAAVCESNGGTYTEMSHTITCTPEEGQPGIKLIYYVLNYPDCFIDCDPADMERIQANNVLLVAQSVEEELQFPCLSEYDIEEGDPDDGDEDNTRFCPNQKNVNPEVCYEKMINNNEEGLKCNCYAFCGSELVGCTDFGATRALKCHGGETAVSGCSQALFDQGERVFNKQAADGAYNSKAVVLPGLFLAAAGFILLL